ncbi:hypothetical protein TNCT_488781 [Trichonephila clavata]|uniref:Uncharacterized protein n=1 Tax=Trichonephila clavata TaxID=2740835 RepID=A0A8X6LDT8_TRICU|nr:hypothetical protein TNCT_354731 [Trichonephila clavata]GFR04827.1 hypothetical protein TNCT_488781 [Trichonephila clavata]
MERGSDRTPDQDRGIKVGRKSLEIRGEKSTFLRPCTEKLRRHREKDWKFGKGAPGSTPGADSARFGGPPGVQVATLAWSGSAEHRRRPGGLRFALSDGPRGFLSFSGPWRASGDLGSPFPVFWEFLIFFSTVEIRFSNPNKKESYGAAFENRTYFSSSERVLSGSSKFTFESATRKKLCPGKGSLGPRNSEKLKMCSEPDEKESRGATIETSTSLDSCRCVLSESVKFIDGSPTTKKW